MQRAAAFQLGMTPVCRKLGFGVLEISIAAGMEADLMAGSAGAAGAVPDVLHQPQGYQHAARRGRVTTWASRQSRALGLGVREISIAVGTGADVMAGGSGAAGPAPDVRHQPPGNLGYLKKNKYMQGYPCFVWDIPRKNRISQHIPG